MGHVAQGLWWENLSFFCCAVEVQEEGMSAVQLFFTFIFSVLGLLVLVVVGLMIYSRWKENKRKRFYWSHNSGSACIFRWVFLGEHMTQQCKDCHCFFFCFFYWTIQSNQLNRQRHGSEAREPWEHKEPRWTGKPAVKWFFFSVMENRIDQTCFSKKCLNVLKHAMLVSTCSIMGLQRGTSRHCRFNSPVSVVMSGKD